jgi:hypothetical protein
MQTARPVSGYQVVPLVWEITPRIEAQSPVAVWEPLHTIARSPTAATKHFAATPDDAKRALLADEFGSYIRQAYEYFQGGTKVPGASAALLYYYSALQLAKAELLVVDPDRILGVRIGHGLSHQITNADDPASDFLTVVPGVFPALYGKRTGEVIPPGTKLYIRELLPYVPEIAQELDDVLGTRLMGFPLYYVLAYHAGELFTLLLAEIPKGYEQRYVNDFESAISGAFEEIPLRANWKKLFGISSRAYVSPKPRLFQSKATFPDGTVIDDAAWSHVKGFKHSVDNPIEDRADAIFFPKLNGLPMTSSLARYALMFYLSSVVRYKPSILSRNRYPDLSWILEAFVQAAPMNLVTNASDGIRGKWNIYGTRLRY